MHHLRGTDTSLSGTGGSNGRRIDVNRDELLTEIPEQLPEIVALWVWSIEVMSHG